MRKELLAVALKLGAEYVFFFDGKIVILLKP
jgi:hypothetical protein